MAWPSTGLVVVGHGQVKAYYNDTLAATIQVDSSGDYFKAGCAC
ncbi:MAG: hypothetical protein ACRDQH_03215 [Pseudonocardiaceae bacterium]